MSHSSSFVNLADPQWELVDPTPNVHALFIQFDTKFFWGKLPSVVVRWSKKMYSCAGICRYQGRGGLCDIALSEPLLKLRPRKDLVETLLHEMIHAYLFLSDGDRDRDGHGPNFCMHMNRINKVANLNISIYHSFHDEVKIYQTHWWRCNGPCQNRNPFFGMVRRTCNRAPGPNDRWWSHHQQTCAGTFIKVKEPEKKAKSKTDSKKKVEATTDITKFVTKSTSTVKTLSDLTNKAHVKEIGSGIITVISDPKKSPAKTNITPKQTLVDLWTTPTKSVVSPNPIKNDNVLENVRNHWANKSIPTLNGLRKRKEFTSPESNNNSIVVIKKRKFSPTNSSSVDDEEAASILKDIYGEDFTIFNAFRNPQPSTSSPIPNRTSADTITNKKTTSSNIIDLISTDIDIPKRQSTSSQPHITNQTSNEITKVEYDEKVQLVDCPLCMKKIKYIYINEHLDTCLGSEKKTTSCKDVVDLTTLDGQPDTDSANCPVCNQKVTGNLEEHIDKCLDTRSNAVITECPVCNQEVTGSLEDHMETCLSFFQSPESIPEEGHNSSILSAAEIHDLTVNSFYDDDGDVGDLDETSTLNETGSKCPCPCCLNMIEQNLMNSHLDNCLVGS